MAPTGSNLYFLSQMLIHDFLPELFHDFQSVGGLTTRPGADGDAWSLSVP
jgi:hypothetical protein